MTMSDAANRWRGKIAALSYAVSAGKRPEDDPELIEARQGLRAQRLADYIKATLAGKPALTPEQIKHAAALLLSAGGER